MALCDGGLVLVGEQEGWEKPCGNEGEHELTLPHVGGAVVHLCDWHMSNARGPKSYRPEVKDRTMIPIDNETMMAVVRLGFAWDVPPEQALRRALEQALKEVED